MTVYLKSEAKTEKRKPEARIFCAKRAWDQKTETGIMREIEVAYQKLAERFLADSSKDLKQEDHDTISDMYILWSIRFSHSKKPIEDQTPNEVLDVAVKMSKDDIERLESNGISSVRPSLEIPGRQIAGPIITLKIFRERKKLKGTKWHVIKSTKDDFIVPDQSLERMILPLSPEFCFVHESDSFADNADADEINKVLIKNSDAYYFGKTL